MKVIKTADAVEGTVLAKDVRNSTGQVLIHSGVVLTPEILATLIKRGISQMTVQEDGDNEAAEITDADVEKAKEICHEVVRQRFSNPDSDPMTQLLFRAALEHSARRMAQDKP
jgi:hypothetical protein